MRSDVKAGLTANGVIVVWSRARRVCPGCGSEGDPEREIPVEPVEGGEERVQQRSDMYHTCGAWWGPIVISTHTPDADEEFDPEVIFQLGHQVGVMYDHDVVREMEPEHRDED